MSGPFVPDTYVSQNNSPGDVKIAAVAWGFTLGFGYLTCVKAVKQTRRVWKRSHRINTYIALVWVEIISSVVYGILAWLLMEEVMPMNFYALFFIVVAWSLELQALLQIIINRISVLIVNKRQVSYLRWGVATFMTLVNVSVFVIWIPARLQVSDRWLHVNSVWDRIEKVLYLIVDGCLNGYFLYHVHSKLVAAGLTKYQPLFRFNAFIVCVSLSMDVLIIGMMNLQNSFVYTMFHPLAYMVKLNIELTMASLITKIARQPGTNSGDRTCLRSDAERSFQDCHPSTLDASHINRFLASGSREQQSTCKVCANALVAQINIARKERVQRETTLDLYTIEDLSDSDDEDLRPDNPSEARGVIVEVCGPEQALRDQSISL